MRPMLTAFAIAAISASCVLAQDKPLARDARATKSFESANKEFLDARNAYGAEMRVAYEVAKKAGKEKAFKFDKQPPTVVFSPRFLAIAERNPEGPDAIDALKATLETSYGPKSFEVQPTRARAVKILRRPRQGPTDRQGGTRDQDPDRRRHGGEALGTQRQSGRARLLGDLVRPVQGDDPPRARDG